MRAKEGATESDPLLHPQSTSQICVATERFLGGVFRETLNSKTCEKPAAKFLIPISTTTD